MRAAFRDFLRIFSLGAVVLALCTILAGGHWAVFQTAAWAKMVYKYSAEMSFFEAVGETFAGSPCDMCEKVRDGWENETKAPLKAADHVSKLEFCFVSIIDNISRPVQPFSYPALGDLSLALRSEAPPVPVPIAA